MVVVVIAVLATGLDAPDPTAATPGPDTSEAAAAPVPGAGAERPRLLYRPGDETELRLRLAREPYRTVFLTMHSRGQAYDQSHALGDPTYVAQRNLSRAARILAFQYALDRTVVDGAIVPFPSAEVRASVGDRVRDLLLQLFDRSRMSLALPSGVGGTDRDISTAEEITNWATAYDTLLGGGYDLGDADDVIVARLANVTSELRAQYDRPQGGFDLASLHQNNHRSKSGAAMALAAIALAEYAGDGDDPHRDRDPRSWWDDGITLVDDVLRYMLVTGDGAYAEGPFYYQLTTQNVVPYARARRYHLGDAPWTTTAGIEIPPVWGHPLFERTQRWMLDMTLPDGSMAPIDDGNPGRSHYFGVAPADHPDAGAFAWRWANAPQRFETDGSVDLSPDSIVIHDDAVDAAPPARTGATFYVEGGNAIFRSGWEPDDVVAIVLGEHDTASSFGRDRTGAGRGPQSHEHPDPGSFKLWAHGERLALDPGYLSFPERHKVNRPEHHNVILVDGAGPADYLAASIQWRTNPFGRPPAEGHATIGRTVDAPFLGAATVATAYSGGADEQSQIARRFLFADDAYLVVADDVRGPGSEHTYTWMLHGNGGGSSGGTFTPTPHGGRWERPQARMDNVLAADTGTVAFDAATYVHEEFPRRERTHTALEASVTATSVRTAQIVYPTPTDQAAPITATVDVADGAGVALLDPDADRLVALLHRDATASTGAPLRALGGATDGHLGLWDLRLDGRLRLAWADGATVLAHGGHEYLRTTTPGSLGLRLATGRAEVHAGGADPTVTVRGLDFEPVAADGACGLTTGDGGVTVDLNRERRVVLRATPGNSAPAADPGPDRRVAPGSRVTLDGTRSCDLDGDDLTPRWQLVSAPAGSTWSLTGADTWRPELVADGIGAFRVRLVVTDEHGAASDEAEVVVIAGGRCEDGIDNDLSGWIDTDDPDCDGPEPRPPGLDDRVYSSRSGSTLTVGADSGVLADATSPDGEPLAGVLVEGPAHGHLALGVDGSFTYEPEPGFVGTDRFRVRARDARYLESEPADVFVVVGQPTHGFLGRRQGARSDLVHISGGPPVVTLVRGSDGAALGFVGRGSAGTADVAVVGVARPDGWVGAIRVVDPETGPTGEVAHFESSVREPAPGILVGTGPGTDATGPVTVSWLLVAPG